jgi:hypothetical protein
MVPAHHCPPLSRDCAVRPPVATRWVYPAVPVPAVTISAIAQEIVLAAAGRPSAW